MKITKVCLKEFIETLIFAYNRGADYADIIVDDEGVITIAVAEEYMNKEEEEKEEYMQINDVLLKKLMN